MSVHALPIDTPLTDVPGRLRKLAQQIEAGEQPGRIAIVVTVDDDGRTHLYGFGEIGRSAEALGWLVRALREDVR